MKYGASNKKRSLSHLVIYTMGRGCYDGAIQKTKEETPMEADHPYLIHINALLRRASEEKLRILYPVIRAVVEPDAYG